MGAAPTELRSRPRMVAAEVVGAVVVSGSVEVAPWCKSMSSASPQEGKAQIERMEGRTELSYQSESLIRSVRKLEGSAQATSAVYLSQFFLFDRRRSVLW